MFSVTYAFFFSSYLPLCLRSSSSIGCMHHVRCSAARQRGSTSIQISGKQTWLEKDRTQPKVSTILELEKTYWMSYNSLARIQRFPRSDTANTHLPMEVGNDCEDAMSTKRVSLHMGIYMKKTGSLPLLQLQPTLVFLLIAPRAFWDVNIRKSHDSNLVAWQNSSWSNLLYLQGV